MTTTITVEAHSASSKFVQVDVVEGGKPPTTTLMEDGTKGIFYAYDDRQIVVRERLKDEPPSLYAAFASHQQRVLQERDELADKGDKLSAFLGSNIFAALEADERERLSRQLYAMGMYLTVLNERIAAFPKVPT